LPGSFVQRMREKSERAKQDIEVEYKEFSVSEFLEIRKKSQVAEDGGADDSGREA